MTSSRLRDVKLELAAYLIDKPHRPIYHRNEFDRLILATVIIEELVKNTRLVPTGGMG